MKSEKTSNKFNICILVIIGGLVWSGVGAHYWRMWLLEIMPVIAGLGIIISTNKKFPLSQMALISLTAFGLLHLIGAHSSYSEAYIGDFIRDAFNLERNPFDRIVHFLQGMVSAILFRELLIRMMKLQKSKGLYLLVCSCSLAFGATYELLEFGAYKIILLNYTTTSSNVLGAQGDPWDTQWDMLLCLIGANVSLMMLAKLHDLSIASLSRSENELLKNQR